MSKYLLIVILMAYTLFGYCQTNYTHTIKVRKSSGEVLKTSENCFFCLAERKGDKLLLFGELDQSVIQADYFKRTTEFYSSEDIEILGFRVYYFGARSEKTSWIVEGHSFPETLRQLLASAQNGERFLFEGIRIRAGGSIDSSLPAFVIEYE